MKGTVRFDFNNMCVSRVGIHAIPEDCISKAEGRVAQVHAAMCTRKPEMAWRQLPYKQTDTVAEIKKTAAEIREKFENFVVLGIGGSALGTKAVFSACCHPFYNELPTEKRGGPRFYVLDNVDPDLVAGIFDTIDPEKTAFNVVTKSGNTIETISQFFLVSNILKEKLGEHIKDNIFFTVGTGNGILQKIISSNGWKGFVVPEGVGGRFSVLSPVGLFPAAVLGIDIESLLAGAADMDKLCSMPSISDNPAYLYALLYTEAMKKGVNISVILPYTNALAPTAEWYSQLWSESLGKRVDNNGRIVYVGQTPVRAVGVTDQHSQIQLYNEGPFDKIISFIEIRNFKNQLSIPVPSFNAYESDYLGGQSFNKLISSEFSATVRAVTDAGKMNNTITLSELNEYTFGKLLFFFEMAAAAAGEFLNINAFNQPGVEAGKLAAYSLMGKSGCENIICPSDFSVKSENRLVFSV